MGFYKCVSDLRLDLDFALLGSVECIITGVKKLKNAKGEPYQQLELMDSTGTILGRVTKDCRHYGISYDDVKNKIYKVSGFVHQIETSRGQKKIFFIDGIEEDENSGKTYVSFIFNFPVDVSALYTRYSNLLAKIKNPNIKDFVSKFIANTPGFSSAPAAISIHHNYKGGLLEHSVNVAMIAFSTAKLYEKDEVVNTDYIIAGGLLHDIGKVKCYALDPSPKITIQADIYDHIVAGYSMVKEAMENTELTQEEKDNILHIILSHHGKREFGSPVNPFTVEAIIVAQADHLDAATKEAIQAIREIDTNRHNISEYKKSIGHSVWNGKYMKGNRDQILD